MNSTEMWKLESKCQRIVYFFHSQIENQLHHCMYRERSLSLIYHQKIHLKVNKDYFGSSTKIVRWNHWHLAFWMNMSIIWDSVQFTRNSKQSNSSEFRAINPTEHPKYSSISFTLICWLDFTMNQKWLNYSFFDN